MYITVDYVFWNSSNLTTVETVTMTDTTTLVTTTSPLNPTNLPDEVVAALVISIILIFSTLIMLIYANRKFESDRAITVCCFLLTMSAQHITLVSGLYATANLAICRAVALMIHFFELSEAFWTLGMIVQIVLKATYKTPDIGSTSQYCALGWITPLFVVASTAGLNLNKYGNDTYCFLPVEEDIIFAFLVPGLLIIATNYVCLCYVLYEYVTTKKRDRKNLPQVLSVVPNARACAVVSLFLMLDWGLFILALRMNLGAVNAIWACNKLAESIFIFLLFGVFSTEVQSEYERRVGPCCPWVRKSSRAVMDSPSPRPGWRDEVSQISNAAENSVMDNDSTVMIYSGLHSGNSVNADSTTSLRGQGSANSHTRSLLNSSSGKATSISGSLMNNGNGDAFNRAGTSEQNGRPSSSRRTKIDPQKAKDALNDSTSSIASTMASTLNLKTKLKVFPLRKLNDQEHTRITNADQSDSPNDSGDGSPVKAPKKRVGWGKIMGGRT
ncbi:cadherin EGF LAG seven-pass G-type receptor 3-like [Diadema setosum]|uniref:cadherin EGF LAG seven-pass G-type receptor 3-like n=1 Tax=Diadema setosum TaxID=31175 RepID=UPI003B3A775A